MRRIFYAGTSFLTGEDIAAALFEYAESLARTTRADSVELPVVTEDGEHIVITLLIGPASQLASQPVIARFTVPHDAILVADLHDRLRRIAAPHPMAETGATIAAEEAVALGTANDGELL